ncbi:hypothetical protein THIOSC13_180002 [uncultured Thiomicrorhabdus sp.]
MIKTIEKIIYLLNMGLPYKKPQSKSILLKTRKQKKIIYLINKCLDLLQTQKT